MRIGRIVYRHSAIVIALLCAYSVSAKDGIEKTKKISESFSVGAHDTFYLDGGEGDVSIETWDQNKVSVDITVTVRTEEEADALEFLENANASVEKVSDGVRANMQLCVSIMSNNSKMKVKFKGGKWIKIQGYSVIVNVKIPKTNNVNLDCSYGKITVANIGGNATAKVYDSKVKFHDVAGSADLDIQYGSMEVGKLSNPKRVKLYEVDFTCGDVKNGSIETSYSTITLGTWQELQLKSYEDEITFVEIGALEGQGQYSKIKGKKVASGDLTLYESKFDVDEVGSLKLQSQYSKYDIEKLGSATFDSSYEDEYNLGECGTFEGKGQYVRYQSRTLSDRFSVDCYECEFDIKLVEKGTKRFELLGSYGNADLTLESGLVYDLDIDVQYPSIHFPEEDFESRVNLDHEKAEAFLKHRDGASNRALFKVHGYEMKVTIGK
jgi:hypothetical protein